MEKLIRIGSLSNELALWRANIVAKQLEHIGHNTEIISIESLDNNDLDKIDFALNTTNQYTRKADIALLNNQIDIAVHDLSLVSTKLPEGIVQVAVLKRGNFNDILMLKSNEDFFSNKTARIATNSLRCKSQWLHRYPHHTIVGLNSIDINENLVELKTSDWDGAIFSMSDLKRINLLPEDPFKLGWMIPAAAQGTVMISALSKNEEIINACKELNDKDTEVCTTIEREFVRDIEENQNPPIGALATIKEEEDGEEKKLKFRGTVFSPDGKNKIEFSKEVPANHTTDIAQFAAKFLLDRNAKKMMRKTGEVQKEIQIFSTKNLSITQTSALNNNIGISMSDFISVQYNRLKPKIVKNTIENVVVTNQTAIESLLNSFDKSELKFKNIYCVGRRTKRLIERSIGKVKHVESTIEKLVNYLNKELKEITFFSGNENNDYLTSTLTENGIIVNRIESYKTTFTPNKVDKKYKGILFFSPAEITSFLTANNPNSITVFCNKEATAVEAKKYFKDIITSKISTTESLLQSVNQHYTTKQT